MLVSLLALLAVPLPTMKVAYVLVGVLLGILVQLLALVPAHRS